LLHLGSDTQLQPIMHLILPWVLASLSIALLLGAGIIALLKGSRRRPVSLPTEWALTSRPVFSTDERRVYRQLREALPHHIVLSKLPLVRFCQPSDPQEVRFWYDLLGAIHVTFAICSANGRVLAAIDLDNARAGSRRSIQIKQSVLGACRVRYLRCSVDHLPSIPELQLLVPQSGAASRGPHAAQAAPGRNGGPGGTPRRRDRTTLWQDSGFLQDSFFGIDSQQGELSGPSHFGGLRSGMSVRELPTAPPDIGGVVVDTPASPLRH
jgi:hypothetical protein